MGEDIELASLPSRIQTPILNVDDANAEPIVPCDYVPCDAEVNNALQLLDATIDAYDC